MGESRSPKWAATKSVRSSFALGLVWGVMALLGWSLIVVDRADADWFQYLGAVFYTCASLIYLNSARVLRQNDEHTNTSGYGPQ